MSEIIFDTETTGLSPAKGDKIIEIVAIELINKFPTGNIYHQYINTGGFPIHPDAERIHGINAEFLQDKPIFRDIAEEFLEFFTDATLIAHNAKFDMGFVNAELKFIGKPAFSQSVVIDTLEIAKRKHPMGPNSLDALCKRYGIDNSRREKHGALLDSELLAEVYIELLGGKQAKLELVNEQDSAKTSQQHSQNSPTQKAKQRENPLAERIDADAINAHQEFIGTLGDAPIWKKYSS